MATLVGALTLCKRLSMFLQTDWQQMLLSIHVQRRLNVQVNKSPHTLKVIIHFFFSLTKKVFKEDCCFIIHHYENGIDTQYIYWYWCTHKTHTQLDTPILKRMFLKCFATSYIMYQHTLHTSYLLLSHKECIVSCKHMIIAKLSLKV